MVEYTKYCTILKREIVEASDDEIKCSFNGHYHCKHPDSKNNLCFLYHPGPKLINPSRTSYQKRKSDLPLYESVKNSMGVHEFMKSRLSML